MKPMPKSDGKARRYATEFIQRTKESMGGKKSRLKDEVVTCGNKLSFKKTFEEKKL